MKSRQISSWIRFNQSVRFFYTILQNMEKLKPTSFFWSSVVFFHQCHIDRSIRVVKANAQCLSKERSNQDQPWGCCFLDDHSFDLGRHVFSHLWWYWWWYWWYFATTAALVYSIPFRRWCSARTFRMRNFHLFLSLSWSDLGYPSRISIGCAYNRLCAYANQVTIIRISIGHLSLFTIECSDLLYYIAYFGHELFTS